MPGKSRKRSAAVPRPQPPGLASGRRWSMAPWAALLLATVCTLAGISLAQLAGEQRTGPRLYTFTIKATYPHDPAAFTQGLEFDRLCEEPGNCTDVLWESTGMNGESEVRLVELATGRVLRSKALAQTDFGEGMVKAGDRLLQLIWMTNKVYSYRADDFGDVRTLQSPLKDGWGITHTGGPGTDLVISDGSPTLTTVDPNSLARKASVQVADEERPVRFLNELEWVKGEVWANVWQSECIARIEPKSGRVRGWVLLHGLLQKLRKRNVPQAKPMDVLNGIAWDKEGRRLFVTGKYWPALFELQLRPHPQRHDAAALDDARRACIV